MGKMNNILRIIQLFIGASGVYFLALNWIGIVFCIIVIIGLMEIIWGDREEIVI